MAGTVTHEFRLYNATRFYEEFSEAQSSSVYLFIARSTPWGDDTTPPTPGDSVEEVSFRTWDYIMGMKKINASDVSFGAYNIPWQSGVVYTQYTSNTSYTYTGPTINKFYVVTDDFNVYKCLYNNNGAASTINPSGQLTSSFSTGDGYQWKFMFPITSASALKFLTTGFMPVKTLATDDGSLQWTIQSASANGSIETILPTAGGSGYLSNAGTLVSATANTAVLGVTANTTNGSYNNYSVYLTGGTGSGQLKRIIGYNGGTRRITVQGGWSVTPDASSTYLVSPTVTITGDGTAAKAYSIVNGSKQISRFKVTTIGQNYSYADVAITANSSSGTGATAKAQVSPWGGHGSDPVRELVAHNIIMNVKLTGSESNTFTTQNDWRQIGILVNPKLASNGAIATGSLYDTTTKLNITGGSGTFVRDEKIIGSTSGASGYIVEYSTSTKLSVIGVRGIFTTETITGQSSGATATISSKVNPPLKRYTGNILYVENKSPVSRSPEQSEDYKITIRY